VKRRLHPPLAALVFAGAIALVGCGVSAVTLALDAVVAAAETAAELPNPPAYVGQIADAAIFAADELASSDSVALKVSKIAGEFAAIAVPSAAAGSPVALIAQAVTNFLALLNTSSAQLERLPVYADSFAARKTMKLGPADQARLKKIRARAEAVKAKLNKK
jgi:hypothetical protein